VEKDELFEEDPLAHAVFRVSRLGLGYPSTWRGPGTARSAWAAS